MKLPSKVTFLRATNKAQSFIKEKPYVLMVAFVLVGVLTLIFTSAASTTVSLQPEDAACSGLKQTSQSGYSGNGYVKFASNPCGNTSNFGYVWKPIKMGAGGFATGIETAPDGTRVIRTDSNGAWIWDANLNGGEWRALISKMTMEGTGLDSPKSGGGAQAIAISQSNPSIIYLAWKGYLLKSTDKGMHFTKLNIEGTEMDPNAKCRAWGGRLAIDPNNPNVVYFGSMTHGLYVTTNGNDFSKVTSIPVSQTEEYCGESGINSAGITAISFDKSSGTSSGKTNTIYLSSHKNGVYRSTNAGASFTQISGGSYGGPNSVVHGQAGGGNYFAVGFNGQNAVTTIYKYNGSGWQVITPSGWQGATSETEVSTLAVNPSNPNNILVAEYSGDLYMSTNAGSSWVAESSHKVVAPIMPWIELNGSSWLVTSQIAFDQTTPNRLWLAMGNGVCYTDVNPSNLGNITWTHQSQGMEQLVQNDVISPPYTTEGQARLNLAVSDYGIFRITNPDTFSAVRWPVQRFIGTWSLDWASQNPNVIVQNSTDVTGSQMEAGYSTDGGLTSTRFASMPIGSTDREGYGTIAAGDANHFLWEVTNIKDNSGNTKRPAKVYYTENAGNSWQDVTPSDITDPTGLHNGYFAKKKNVAFDRVTPGVAYLYYNNANTYERVYRSTNYGKNWTKVFEVANPTSWDSRNSTLGSGDGLWNPTMKPVPNKAGHLFFTSGPSGSDTLIGNKSAAGNPLKFSADGGTTWKNVVGGNQVYGFGFGIAKPGTDYPTVYTAGFIVNPTTNVEEYGIWRGESFNPTTGVMNWVKIGDFPYGNLSQPFSFDGDKQVFGKVYYSTGSDGAFYGVPQ